MKRILQWLVPCVAGLSGCSDAGILQLDTGAANDSTTSADDDGTTSADSDSPTDGSTGTGAPNPGIECSGGVNPTAVFHVQLSGDDVTGNGEEATPWATLEHAIASVPDGSLIEVGPGEYIGEHVLDGVFAQGVVVRAEPRYLARLRNNGPVLSLLRTQGVTIEGFDIAHSGPGAEPFVVQIRDELGEAGDAEFPTRINLRDNIIHDSFNNDLLRIDSGVEGVLVESNIFYNQGSADEQIDINAARDVIVRGNVFFNDFAASGRTDPQDTASFIIVKDADGDEDGITGASDILIDGNIMMNWEGDSSMNMVLLAERGHPTYGAQRVTVQNNLFLVDGDSPIRAPFGVKGARDIVFRSNTTVGDLPANAFAFRLNVEGDSPPNDNIEFYNNIWSAPGGSMEDLTDTEPSSPLENLVLDTNLYWNGSAPVPTDDTDIVNVDSDLNPVLADPALPPSQHTPPVWSPQAGRFAGGEATICDVFEGLVVAHATLGPESAAVGVANSAQLPALDILKQPRKNADLGAFEAP